MSAVSSLALNAATAIFVTVYVLLAQQRSLWFSVSLALAAWLATAVTLTPVHWTAWSAAVLNVAVLALCLVIVEPFRHVRMMPTNTLLVRLRGAGSYGDAVGRRSSGLKFQNWSRRERRACHVPSHLHEYYGDLASPRRRSRNSSTASKRHFRLCGIWRSTAYAASHRSTIWVRRCPHRRSWRLRLLERHHLRRAAPSPNSRLRIISIVSFPPRRRVSLSLLPHDGSPPSEMRRHRTRAPGFYDPITLTPVMLQAEIFSNADDARRRRITCGRSGRLPALRVGRRFSLLGASAAAKAALASQRLGPS